MKDSADKGRIELAKQEYERIKSMKRGEYEDFRRQVNRKRRAREEKEYQSNPSSSDSESSEEDFKVRSSRAKQGRK